MKKGITKTTALSAVPKRAGKPARGQQTVSVFHVILSIAVS